ncbi:uncharacterized protein N7484_000656 [Penicillium longicatenatum]|uniref:uncharacterized protein n=1 Tax=Penicillium longicatenatum TaxID=1561947 RepID=UPI002546AEAA|nr:uncharacterized protein N7484_000656 [Penicillium longicatenatum]KAJ5661284.1 hypothetical protein N7484_000656 [Penicillium longicatenatum]
MSESPLDNPNGRGLTWIFDHCLRYPTSYEIPLRTMYTINCNPAKNPNSTRPQESAFSPRHSASSKSSSEDSIDASADFRSQLIYQISRLPSQPCALPPAFLTSFLRRVWIADLDQVDFPQALTALDYLRDLDARWKKEMYNAIQRLGISRADVEDPVHSGLALNLPGVMSWLETMKSKGRYMEALYTQIYVGLRRWTLLNEMILDHTNKVAHVAMLNTLFPPVEEKDATPTSQLTHHILKVQRSGFFTWINAVSRDGNTNILNPVIAQGAPEGEATSWPIVRDSVEKYLTMAQEMIDECMLIHEPANLEEPKSPQSAHRTKGRKVDSGISFASSTSNLSLSETTQEKPLPYFPAPTSPPAKSAGSALERLATEIRRMGLGNKTKSLKKMKSTTTFGIRPSSQDSYEGSFFEIDEQKRRRLIGEATSRKKSQANDPALHTQ